jgi:N-acetylneuraminic acid mutarotase
MSNKYFIQLMILFISYQLSFSQQTEVQGQIKIVNANSDDNASKVLTSSIDGTVKFMPISQLQSQSIGLPTSGIILSEEEINALLLSNNYILSKALVSQFATPGNDQLLYGSWNNVAPNVEARFEHKAVWTGTEMLVWGGRVGSAFAEVGYKYNPTTNVWTAMSTQNQPAGRTDFGMVWTGTEMIVYGGFGATSVLNDGGRYNPTTNTWTTMGGTPPPKTVYHSTIWTGTDMIIWGGGLNYNTASQSATSNNYKYNPTTDTWTLLNSTTGIQPRLRHSAIWTGTEIIVWGGHNVNHSTYYNNGAKYNVLTDTWSAISTPTLQPRYGHHAFWTGSKMIIYGGIYSDGALYDLNTNLWTPMSTPQFQIGWGGTFSSTWTNTDMIVWGGTLTNNFLEGLTSKGGRYNLATNTWTEISEVNALSARILHSAIWTGSEMIIFGGYDDIDNPYNDAKKFNPFVPGFSSYSDKLFYQYKKS